MISGHVVVINNADLSGGDIFSVPKLSCEPRGSPSQKEIPCYLRIEDCHVNETSAGWHLVT
jgi:hypothetical protein